MVRYDCRASQRASVLQGGTGKLDHPPVWIKKEPNISQGTIVMHL